MTITFKCLNCGQALQAEQTDEPSRVACPKCGKNVAVPKPIGGTLTGKTLARTAGPPPVRQPAAAQRPATASADGLPQAVPAAVVTEDLKAPSGLFRSDRLLVIVRGVHRFPNSCLWCNSPAPDERTDIIASWADFRLGKSGLRNLAAYSQRAQCALHVPICDDCTTRRHGKSRIAIVIGIVFLIIGVLAFAFVGTSNRGPQDRVLISAAAIGVGGVVIGIFSLVVSFAFKHGYNDYTVRYIDDRHVWMPNVHSDFLAPLPEFPSDITEYIRSRKQN